MQPKRDEVHASVRWCTLPTSFRADTGFAPASRQPTVRKGPYGFLATDAPSIFLPPRNRGCRRTCHFSWHRLNMSDSTAANQRHVSTLRHIGRCEKPTDHPAGEIL